MHQKTIPASVQLPPHRVAKQAGYARVSPMSKRLRQFVALIMAQGLAIRCGARGC